MSDSSSDDDLLIIQGKRYWRQERWSRDKKITTRTTIRHRERGLPWLEWAGHVFIPEDAGDAYIASHIKRRNPPRRRQQAITAEIGGLGQRRVLTSTTQLAAIKASSGAAS